MDEYLIRCRIIGMERVDTRAITRHIREKGALKAVISTEDLNPDSLVQKAIQGPPLVGVDLAKEVTTEEPYCWQSEGNYTIAAVSYTHLDVYKRQRWFFGLKCDEFHHKYKNCLLYTSRCV